MAQQRNGNTRTENRLTALETGQEQIRHDVQGMREDLSAFMAEARRGQKPPWGTLISAASLLLSVVVAVGGLVAYGINSKIDYVGGALEKHEKLEAHPGQLRAQGRTDERIAALRAAVAELRAAVRDGDTKLDEVVQREMRLLDAALKNESKGWIDGLQKQVDAHTAKLDKTVALHTGLSRLEARVEELFRLAAKSK